MKTISSLNLKNKKVLLRVDLNSYVTKKKVHLGERLIAHCKTIKLLQKKKAITVILAHQGRPGQPDFASLKQHSKLLNKYVKVKFINSVIDKKAINKIKSLKPGETLLLENVRTLKDEFNPSTKNELIKKLAPLFNLYINDAFSISHRSQTSIVSFPKVLPHYPGPILIKELNALKKIKLKNTLFILAGAKPEENIHLMGKRNIITAGLFGQICMIAKGFNFGAQNRFLRNKLKILPQLKKKLRNQKTPIDFAIKVN
ncbi:MAG: phosphoglycerate kinase, partial [Nanoarchaeota archaeon]